MGHSKSGDSRVATLIVSTPRLLIQRGNERMTFHFGLVMRLALLCDETRLERMHKGRCSSGRVGDIEKWRDIPTTMVCEHGWLPSLARSIVLSGDNAMQCGAAG